MELPPGAIKDEEMVGEYVQVFFATDCQDLSGTRQTYLFFFLVFYFSLFLSLSLSFTFPRHFGSGAGPGRSHSRHMGGRQGAACVA